MDALCVTWNVLADRYSEPYREIVDHSVLLWENRLKTILKTICRADVICLQEIELNTFQSDFQSLFETHDFVSHVVSKKRSNPIGNVVLWRKRSFTLVESLTQSCAVHVLLELPGSRIWICNVHLKAGLKSGEPERINQIQSCISNWKSRGSMRGIICGDFNDHMISGGSVREIIEKANFIVVDNQPRTAMIRDGQVFNFDHICSNGIKVTLHPSSIGDICQNVRSDCGCFPKIPNVDNPSDHTPVFFMLKVN